MRSEFGSLSGGVADAQPPANFSHPFRMSRGILHPCKASSRIFRRTRCGLVLSGWRPNFSRRPDFLSFVRSDRPEFMDVGLVASAWTGQSLAVGSDHSPVAGCLSSKLRTSDVHLSHASHPGKREVSYRAGPLGWSITEDSRNGWSEDLTISTSPLNVSQSAALLPRRNSRRCVDPGH